MTHRARLVLAALVLVLCGVGLIVALHGHTADGPPHAPPPVVHFEADGLRYTYHVPTGAEGLFDVGVDPKLLTNLASSRPGDTRRLREALEKEIGVASLDELRRAQQVLIDRLRALGYY